MATARWIGRAQDIAPVLTITPGGTIGTETFTMVINEVEVTYTATGGDVVADVVDGLLAAWEVADDIYPEFAEADVADSTTTLTVTGTTIGVPITITSSATGSATCVTATSTAATGKNFWSNVDNWDGGAVPVSTDTVYIENSDVSILYGLDQNAVTLTSLVVEATYTGDIGLPDTNVSGYREYRDTHLAISATTVKIGTGDGSGSSRIRWNAGSNPTTCDLYRTSSGSGERAFEFLGTHADNVLHIHAEAEAGIAIEGGVASTIKTLTLNGGSLHVGDNVTLNGSGSTFDMLQGAAFFEDGTFLTIDQYGGDLTLQGDGSTATLNVYEGAACSYAQSAGVTGTATIYGALISATAEAKTIANCTLAPGGSIEGLESFTFTNGIQPHTTLRELSAG